jgi:hypothetical protein
MATPVTLECPVACLELSAHSYNRLMHSYGAPFDPPRTVGDVLLLAQRAQLGEIWGLGPRRVGEIEIALRWAGFVVGHRHSSTKV